MFSCELYEISKNTFFTEHLGATASKHLSMQHIKWITSERSRFSTVNFSLFSEIFQQENQRESLQLYWVVK